MASGQRIQKRTEVRSVLSFFRTTVCNKSISRHAAFILSTFSLFMATINLCMWSCVETNPETVKKIYSYPLLNYMSLEFATSLSNDPHNDFKEEIQKNRQQTINMFITTRPGIATVLVCSNKSGG